MRFQPRPPLSRPPRARLLAVVIVALAGAVLAAPPASAHDSIVGSVPTDGATVTTPPVEVRLTFEEPPTTAGLGVAVTAPGGESVVDGPPTVEGDVVVQPLLPLTVAGTYTVAFRVVSQDGHPVTGTVGFRYAARSASTTATASATPTATSSPTTSAAGSDPSTSPLPGVTSVSSATDLTPWVVAGSVVLLVAVVLVGLGLRRRSA